MHRPATMLTAAAALVTLTAGCTGPLGSDAPADLTDDVQRSYAMAERRQLQVTTLTQAHWSRLENSSGDITTRVHQVSAPGNRFFANVFRAYAKTDDPAAPRFRAGMTDDCSYFPIGTAPNPEHTHAVARICLDHNGHISGTWWRVIDL